jgi:hypothetical protein
MVMAANLARHQMRLNADLPLVLMTDARDADWAAAVRRLPRGSVVVVAAAPRRGWRWRKNCTAWRRC